MNSEDKPLNQWAIDELIVALREATPEAANDYFMEIISRFKNVLLREHRKMADIVEFQEYCQEVYLHVFLGLPKLKDPEAFPGFFIVIARHVASDLKMNKLRRPTESLEEMEGFEIPVSPLSEDKLLAESLLSAAPLTPVERQVMTLLLADLSPKEIARLLDSTESTVRMYKSRAAEKLRKYLRGETEA